MAEITWAACDWALSDAFWSCCPSLSQLVKSFWASQMLAWIGLDLDWNEHEETSECLGNVPLKLTLAEYSTSLQFPVVLAPCILHRFKISSSRQSCHQVWLWISLPRTGAEATFTVANFTMIVGLFTLPCLFARHGWSTGNRHTIKGVNSMKGWMIPSRT